jgi:CelD/BcsL family acetyltransferase involved in cellulose biosynthesis
VTLMRCNGAVAAIAIACGMRRAAHLIGHDPALDRLSPGTLLQRERIWTASTKLFATFDLLAPANAP